MQNKNKQNGALTLIGILRAKYSLTLNIKVNESLTGEQFLLINIFYVPRNYSLI